LDIKYSNVENLSRIISGLVKSLAEYGSLVTRLNFNLLLDITRAVCCPSQVETIILNH